MGYITISGCSWGEKMGNLALQKLGDNPCNWGYTHTYIYIEMYILIWLVVYLPLWKMMEFVSWDDDIPNWMESHNPVMFQTTNQMVFSIAMLVYQKVYIYIYIYIYIHTHPLITGTALPSRHRKSAEDIIPNARPSENHSWLVENLLLRTSVTTYPCGSLPQLGFPHHNFPTSRHFPIFSSR